MLSKINLIRGIGVFDHTVGSSIKLSKVNVFYGENRLGKSTLGDILYSLASNDSKLILSRKAIPNDLNKPPKVVLQFETTNGRTSNGSQVVTYEREAWQRETPVCSKIYVFDHSFIHRNVMTGQKLERKNSQNITSFILGEANIVLYRELAELNKQLRKERSKLSNLQSQLQTHDIANPQKYATSPLPNRSMEKLQADVNVLQEKKQQIAKMIQNSSEIKARRVLRTVGKEENFTPNANTINSTLASSMQDIHRQTFSILNIHVEKHVRYASTFKGWAEQGLGFLKNEFCPFCGQGLGEDAKSLISAYQKVFDRQFRDFGKNTRQTLDRLRQPFPLTDTKSSLNQQHQSNKDAISLYTESKISKNRNLLKLIKLIDQKFGKILVAHTDLSTDIQLALDSWIPLLKRKYSVPYEPNQQIDFSRLISSMRTYNQAISEYYDVMIQINKLLNEFKNSIDVTKLDNLREINQRYEGVYLTKIRRIKLEPICQQYRSQLKELETLEHRYDQKRDQLNQSQKYYLSTFFQSINQLFSAFGSKDFKISTVANNRGHQVVYELRVKFKNQDIPYDKLNFVFSESDRRALALCIFLAKVLSLPDEEKAKAILVFDDPVTSFDNERITLILNKFDELRQNVKQLIIITHYKGMASKAIQKFDSCAKSIILMPSSRGIEIQEIDNEVMTATAHDLAFDRIKAFVAGEVNENLITELRPFFEAEIRNRFKKQLSDLGHTKTKTPLGFCITQLKNNDIISQELAQQLHAFHNSLNSPMHEIGQSTIENTRSIANDMLDLIYNKLIPVN